MSNRTSLASQLQSIAAKNPFVANVAVSKRRPTFLYADQPKVAQDKDLEDIFDIGTNGLLELIQLNPKFTEFRTTLFATTFKAYDRTLSTKEDNAKIDGWIRDFMRLLSPHFLLKPAAKAFEWLLWRFQVTEFNLDDVVGCCLPYHDTEHFMRICKLLRRGECGRWEFLVQAGKAGLPLDRASFVRQLSKQPDLMDFICQMVNEAIISKTVFNALMASVTTTLIVFVEGQSRVHDNLMLKLLPFILRWVQSIEEPNVQCGAYMLISVLAEKVQFSQDVCVTLMTKISKYASDWDKVWLCLLQLTQTQDDLKVVPESVALKLMKQDGLSKLIDLRSAYDTERMEVLLLLGLLTGNTKSIELLADVLGDSRLTLSKEVAAALITNVFKRLSEGDNVLIKLYEPIVRCLSSRYGTVMDQCLQSITDSQSFLPKLTPMLVGSRNCLAENSGTTLSLGLVHASAEVRLSCLRQLTNQTQTFAKSDPEFLLSAIETAIQDVDDTVGLAAIESLQTVLSWADADRFVEPLVAIVAHPSRDLEIKQAALGALLSTVIYNKHATIIDPLLLSCLMHAGDLSSVVVAALTNASKAKNGLVGALQMKNVVLPKGGNSPAELLVAIVRSLAEVVSSELLSTLVSCMNSGNTSTRSMTMLILMKHIHGSESNSNMPLVLSVLENIQEISLEALSIQQVGQLTQDGLPNLDIAESLIADEFEASKLVSRSACMALEVIVEALPALSDTSSVWLHSANVAESTDRSTAAVVRLFSILSSNMSLTLAQRLLQILLEKTFTCDSSSDNNTSSLLSFLAHQSLADGMFYEAILSFITKVGPLEPRIVALKILEHIIKMSASSDSDFQIIVPAVLTLLTADQVEIRQSALMVFSALRSTYQAKSVQTKTKKKQSSKSAAQIIAATNYYGPSTSADVLFLSLSDVREFLNDLTKSAEASVADQQSLSVFFRSYFTKKGDGNCKEEYHQKQKYLDAMLSHVTACQWSLVQRQILQMLAQVDSKRIPKSCQSLFKMLSAQLKSLLEVDELATEFQLLLLIVKSFKSSATSLFQDGKKVEATYFNLMRSLIALSKEPISSITRFLQLIDALACSLECMFIRLDPIEQFKFVGFLITDVLSASLNVDISARFKQTLASLKISEQTLTALIATTVAILAQPEPASQKQKREDAGSLDPRIAACHQLTIVLEVMSSNSHCRSLTGMIQPMFDLLSSFVSLDPSVNASVSVEYPKQLAMSLLITYVDELRSHELTAKDEVESVVRPDILAQVIRTSVNPLTQNHALQLLASIAMLYPDKVIHSVMPVFTFMGTNMLRQDDDYSFGVIQDALRTIVPPLIKANSASSDDLQTASDPIIALFTDALTHIPRHRRLKLFALLTETLGPKEFLHRLAGCLLTKFEEPSAYPGSLAKSEEPIRGFIGQLFDLFSPEEQLNALVYLIRDSTVNFASDDASLSSLALTTFAAEHLLRPQLISKLDQDAEEGEMIQQKFMDLIEVTLLQLNTIQSHIHHAGTDKSSKAQELMTATLSALANVNGLLSLSAFSEITCRLLAHQNEAVRKTMLTIFVERFQRLSPTEVEANMDELVRVAEACVAVINDNKESSINKQNALLSIGLLCNYFGKQKADVFVKFSDAVLGKGALKSDVEEIKLSALACLAVLVDQLGPQMLPKLSVFMPEVLSVMRAAVESKDDPLLSYGSFSACKAILERLPQFTGPYLEAILSCVLDPRFHSTAPAKLKEDKEVRQMIQGIIDLLPERVAPRLLMQPLFAYEKKAMDAGAGSACAFFDLVGHAVKVLKKDDLTSYYKQLFKFFLHSFDLRTNVSHLDSCELNAVEEHIVSAFMQLVMKLNESLFKPLYLKMIDWATKAEMDDQLRDNRSLFLYNALSALLQHLKSIFAPYCSYILDHAVGMLNDFTQTKMPTAVWPPLLQTLTKMMAYDHDGFLSESQLQSLVPPLVNQLQVTGEDADAYNQRVDVNIVPCLGQLATSVYRAEPALLKQLNHQVLMQTRDEQALVRFSALKVMKEFYSRMGDEFVVHLPETVPFLAELLEDDDEEVERLCREVIQLVEEYLGESLQDLLK